MRKDAAVNSGGRAPVGPRVEGLVEPAHLVTFVRDEVHQLRAVDIIDAANIGNGAVARVHITGPVPSSSHTDFLAHSPTDETQTRREEQAE